MHPNSILGHDLVYLRINVSHFDFFGGVPAMPYLISDGVEYFDFITYVDDKF